MQPITVRLEIAQLRQTILQQFAAHQSDIAAQLEVELDRAIKAFDFDREIQAAVREVLPQAIRDAVKYAIVRTTESYEFREAMSDLVKEHWPNPMR